VEIPAGTTLMVISAAANRDPRRFTDPDTFDPARTNARQHITFGRGIHSCPGSPLARMESAIALEKLLDFMPRYEVDWDGLQRVHMQNVSGWLNVPVRVVR
ncbi:cytochrome P450, partial [Mycolicibacter sinensis]|uniref:cytochrome P450 n=1 Tax=Mycolicibacter sinensis (strain JDM601) TaxID=875328 RepID=UPI000AAA608B